MRPSLFAAVASVLIPFSWLPGSTSDYAAAKQKITMIEDEKLRPGSHVILSSAELNAYIAGEIPQVAGQGAVSDPQLRLVNGGGNLTANIDFVQLQRNTGRKPGWLAQQILSGARPVLVMARVQSSNGKATVWVDRLEVSGIPISGLALDFLMEVFIQPKFPNVRIGEPFDLVHSVDHFEIKPESVRVVIKGA